VEAQTMTIRNLDQMFKPKSLALIGASLREHSVGAVLARALLQTEARIPIYPVNPK
jgi:acetyltransferase